MGKTYRQQADETTFKNASKRHAKRQDKRQERRDNEDWQGLVSYLQAPCLTHGLTHGLTHDSNWPVAGKCE